jgi:2,4-dienoyl-CoA reductase-like NADH-dependent reductase (Old Yellow Enzyme family)
VNTHKWKLLEPVKVGTIWLRNRIVMPSIEARLNRPDGSVTKPMIDYYSERARGGAGAIIVENSYIVGVMPRELTVAEIQEIQGTFAEATRRAKQAGIDGAEVHGAHGYLISEFLSPCTNKRTDRYGGGLESRALFALFTLSNQCVP